MTTTTTACDGSDAVFDLSVETISVPDAARQLSGSDDGCAPACPNSCVSSAE